MTEMKKKVNMIAAVCNGLGIGYGGKLPWPLIKKDHDFLTKSVTSVKDESRRNVVIIGRKTMIFDAECKSFPNVITVVLSRTMQEKPSWTDYLCQSLEDALSLVNSNTLSNQVESVWILGGTELYKIGSKYCDFIYLTRIFQDFQCDTFFPEIDWSSFIKIRDPEINDSEQIDNDIKFQIEVYKRK
ncbi:dihydrofolate reductase-like [Antedon mediterranea]|uniref:dihydrofolate reductase-like n=1 Tax=Antedon mediterranea TaxID=105859 RepID=UPI003AF96CD4